jgi:hypothetical protein
MKIMPLNIVSIGIDETDITVLGSERISGLALR